MRDIQSFYEKAIRLIAEGTDLSSFIAFSYEYFSIPIILVDEGYKLLAYANDGKFEDPYWNDIVENGTASSSTIVGVYMKSGYLDAIAGNEGAVYVNWGVSEKYPQSCGAVVLNKQLVGFLSLLFMEESLKEEVLEINTMLCRLCEVIMQTSAHTKKTMRNPLRQVFARKFFDPESAHEPIGIHSYAPHILLEPRYCICVLNSIEEGSVMEFVRGRIRSYYPQMIYAHIEEKLYILLDNLNSEKMDAVYENLENLLSDYHMHVGVSELFTDMADRHRYIEQAEKALTAGTEIDPEKTLFTYKDYYEEILFMSDPETMDPDNLVPIELWSLKEYDEQNETEYMKSLWVYLYYRNDLNRAAHAMHLHRNTMKYRMDKIEQVIGIDPDEPDQARRLEFGFVMYKLIRNRSREK